MNPDRPHPCRSPPVARQDSRVGGEGDGRPRPGPAPGGVVTTRKETVRLAVTEERVRREVASARGRVLPVGGDGGIQGGRGRGGPGRPPVGA